MAQSAVHPDIMPQRITVSPEMLEKLRFFPHSLNLAGGEHTCDFASYLAECLNDRAMISSEELLLRVEFAFNDLVKGEDSNGRIIRHRATDRVPTVEMFVRMDLPQVFSYVFPPEFIADLERVRGEVLDEIVSQK